MENSNNQIRFKRGSSADPDFLKLEAELDSYLQITDGDEHHFYNQFNGIDEIKNFVIAYDQSLNPIGCGAFKEYDHTQAEIKRMYVKPAFRGLGISNQLLLELESWALSLGYQAAILETGIRQIEAISFYQKMGFQKMKNYGQYAEKNNSLCFRKILK